MTSPIRTAVVLVLSGLAAVPESARAEEDPEGEVKAVTPSTDEKAAAEALFSRGLELHDARQYAEACPLFAESLKLDFGLGTLLYLSDCQEQIGLTASAWAGFKEAAALAEAKGQPVRKRSAEERIAALTPKLSYLVIVVPPEARAEGLAITRGTVPLGALTWDAPLAVDPGPHIVSVTAPGRKGWSQTIDVPAGPATVQLEVPPLERATPEAPPPEPPRTPVVDHRGDVLRVLGIVTGSVGLIGVGSGVGFGVDAVVKWNAALATCEGEDPNLCTQEGVELQEGASRGALISTVTIGVGAGLVTAGALMFLLAPSDAAPPTVPLEVSLGPDGAWLGLTGEF